MDSQTQLNDHPNIKKVVSLESFVFMAIFLAVFGLLGSKMGMINMLNTMMQTAYQLLLDTVFYIMAIAVLAGALSGLFTEFGIVAIINKGNELGAEYIVLEQDHTQLTQMESVRISMDSFHKFSGLDW